MKRVKKMPTFNVILFDFNTQKVTYYNIFPDIIDEWEKEEERKYKIFVPENADHTKMPMSYEQYKYFILSVCKRKFWSRCEYEVVISSWPPARVQVDDNTALEFVKNCPEQDGSGPVNDSFRKFLSEFVEKNRFKSGAEKIDAYQQIEANIDSITHTLIEYIHS